MKNIIAFFSLVLACNSAHALSDFERGVLFFSNAYSYGTFLPEMEGKIALMKAEHQKKLAEFKQSLEKDRQSNLKKMLNEQIRMTQEQILNVSQQKSLLEKKQQRFLSVVKYAEGLFSQKLKMQQVAEEIKVRAEFDQELAENWANLLSDIGMTSTPLPSTEQVEQIFMQALFVQSQFESMNENLQMQLEDLRLDLLHFGDRLGALP